MITYTSDPGTDLVEITAEGAITLADIEAVLPKFKADVARCGKVRVLETLGRIEGIQPRALWEDLKQGLPMMNTVSRAALVTDQSWVGVLSDIAKPFLPATVRHFPTERAAEARAWLDET
jgi:hypothetical protein